MDNIFMYILFDLLIIQCKMNDKKIGFRSLCNINFFNLCNIYNCI